MIDFVNGKRVVDPTIEKWEVSVTGGDFTQRGWKKRIVEAGGTVDRLYDRHTGRRSVDIPNTPEGNAVLDALFADRDCYIRFVVARGPIGRANASVVVTDFGRAQKPDCERNVKSITESVMKRLAASDVVRSDDPVAVAAAEAQEKRNAQHKLAFQFQQHLTEALKNDRNGFWEVVRVLNLDATEALAFRELHTSSEDTAAA